VCPKLEISEKDRLGVAQSSSEENALLSVIDPASSVNEAVEDRATLDGGHSKDPSGGKPH
jgi:hypothetical protein